MSTGDQIILLYPRIGAAAPSKDDQDTLDQAAAVEQALVRLGYATCRQEFSAEQLSEIFAALTGDNVGVVFNLVEEVEGKKQLNFLAAAFLELVGCAFTGCSAHACFVTSNKITSKQIMRSAGIDTPAWTSGQVDEAPLPPGDYLLKPVEGDASQGLDEDQLQLVPASSAPAAVQAQREKAGEDWFAEQYIEGREFNLSLIQTATGPQVLPPAEIVFRDYGQRPRIVGYKAKWDAASFEYQNTVRTFDFSREERPLLDRLASVALECWRVLKLSGYARIDFRVDSSGTPWVLEANANPGIAPDSGFVAAGSRAGLAYHELIERIVIAAKRGEKWLTRCSRW